MTSPGARVDPAARRAVVAAVVGALLAGAYAFSFLFAQATPEPHELPIAIAGPPARVAVLAKRVEAAAGHGYDVRRLDGSGTAREALRAGEVYVAVVVGSGPARLLTAPALGRSAVTATVLALPPLIGAKGTPQVEVVRPLAKDDPEGEALNLQLLPLSIFGIVVPILLLLLASSLTVRARLAALAVNALLAGAGVALVSHSALHALPGSLLALAGLAALLAFAISSCTTALTAALGPPGVALGVLVFLIFGNVASGAAVQNAQLPGAWRVAGPYLPPGAAADAMRSVAYFPDADLLRPLLVLGGFAAVGAALCLVLGGRRPAPQGQPSGPTSDQGA
jgi:hypothetical protein